MKLPVAETHRFLSKHPAIWRILLYFYVATLVAGVYETAGVSRAFSAAFTCYMAYQYGRYVEGG